ncbi:acetylornithine/N-succinyldiaminopimelate aminotransferase [Aequitasia blattaphilus]|uniref:Acetylornithine aminotransferase n=1 Tax=Aequitasia blattaphilus TaxID=2949332 RepID=A0ABT1E9B9_9FIRM|nr:aspartate aminotransferase family protein [Aequitasia blattaphilus]MCP1102281.1 aspartate aminotransferase family protein [Aequitasia blattaphilus]MCR8614921.1 aspartate aminotransferase family protein [Aequitasia blattaphilus]
MKEYIEAANEALVHTYNKLPVVLDKGEGSYLYDTEGKEYLDFSAGIAVSSIGYGNQDFKNALTDQLDHLIHTSNLYHHSQSLEAANGLRKLSGMDRIFFTNSGTEAIEGALKTARKYGFLKDEKKYEFIAMENSFHGRTMGALSVTGTKAYREPFEPLIPGVSFAQYNDIESVKEKITNQTCGIILEPMQGEGGIHPATEEFLKGVRKLCDEKDILLIFDEIQCGMGRCGYPFLWQKYNVKPDILVMAKAIGSGLPVGAFGLTEHVAKNSLVPGDHGTTYGGNPLALRAISATVSIFEKEKLIENAKSMGKYLESKLDELKEEKEVITDRRGVGLMQGIALRTPVGDAVKKAFERGLLLIAAGGNVIRFVPPLTIQKDEIDKMAEILNDIL